MINFSFRTGIQFALMASLLFTGNGNAACRIVAGFGPGAPYNYPDKEGKNIGIDADILRISLAEVGCDIEYRPLPWKRVLAQIEAGTLDATMSASYKDERAKFAHYSVPYRGNPHVIIMDKSATVSATSLLEYLENGHSLGVVLGWHYTNKIRALLETPRFKKQIIIMPKFINIIKMQKKKRILGFLANPSMLAGIVGKERIEQDYRMIRADIDILHFLFSRKSVSTEIAQKFNRNLEERMNSGFFFDVCNKYKDQLLSNCEFLSPR